MDHSYYSTQTQLVLSFFIYVWNHKLSSSECLTGSILQPVTSSSIQPPQLDQLHFADWSWAVGGAVQSLVVHQYGHAIGCEAEVQLHSGRPVPTSLEQEKTRRQLSLQNWNLLTDRKKKNVFLACGVWTTGKKMSPRKGENAMQWVRATAQQRGGTLASTSVGSVYIVHTADTCKEKALCMLTWERWTVWRQSVH